MTKCTYNHEEKLCHHKKRIKSHAPAYLFLEDDRPELVDKNRLEPVANALLDIIDWAMYKSRNDLRKIDDIS